jgi:hypothetical protein
LNVDTETQIFTQSGESSHEREAGDDNETAQNPRHADPLQFVSLQDFVEGYVKESSARDALQKSIQRAGF